MLRAANHLWSCSARLKSEIWNLKSRGRASLDLSAETQHLTPALPVSPPVLPDVLLDFPFDSPAARSLPVVEDILAFGKRNFALDQVILQVNARRDQSEAPLLGAPRELVDFAAVQKQSPVAQRVMVEPAASRIGTDVAIDQPHFVVLNHRVTVLQIDLALANRFHFRPRQLNAAFELFQKVIEMLSLTIDGEVSWGRVRRFAHQPSNALACISRRKNLSTRKAAVHASRNAANVAH